MFYIALILLILLALIVLAVVGLNVSALLDRVSLNLLVIHPSIPILLLCLLGVCLGGLLLYVVSLWAARRDMQEIERLRTRLEELEQEQVKPSGSGSLPTNFVPPVVPMPGFRQTGPLSPGQPSSGSLPLGQLPPSGSLLNLPPSSSGISRLTIPPRPGSPSQAQQLGEPHPPFFSQ
jgi:uncharacterized integral membrane protein